MGSGEGRDPLVEDLVGELLARLVELGVPEGTWLADITEARLQLKEASWSGGRSSGEKRPNESVLQSSTTVLSSSNPESIDWRSFAQLGRDARWNVAPGSFFALLVGDQLLARDFPTRSPGLFDELGVELVCRRRRDPMSLMEAGRGSGPAPLA